MRFAVFIYDGVEPIDLATIGVLSMARRVEPSIEPFTVAPRPGPVTLANDLTVLARYGIDDCPAADALIVTGGPGWNTQAADARTLAFLRSRSGRGALMSVCTGAMLLAAAGVLDGRRATTKREVTGDERQPLALMRERYPAIDVVEARLVDEGPVISGGGVALCIDATLHLLHRMLGARVASETARILEYTNAWRANEAAFPARVRSDERAAG